MKTDVFCGSKKLKPFFHSERLLELSCIMEHLNTFEEDPTKSRIGEIIVSSIFLFVPKWAVSIPKHVLMVCRIIKCHTMVFENCTYRWLSLCETKEFSGAAAAHRCGGSGASVVGGWASGAQ